MKILTCILLLLLSRKIHCHEVHTAEQMRAAMTAVIDEADSCGNNSNVVILVKTAVSYTNHRMAIRETWAKLAKEKFTIPTLFVVARSADPVIMDKILSESQQFHDILMADFIDSYHNLTLKTVFTLNWAHEKCQTSFIVYVDDDVVVNPENLMKFIDGNPGPGLHCFMQRNDRPVREFGHKNYVPYDVYPDEYWPDYCIGPGVILHSTTAGLLVRGALSDEINPKVWIDDCFMYGIVRQQIGCSITDVPSIRVYGFDEQIDCFPNVYEERSIMGIVTWDRMPILWDFEQSILTEGCRPVHEKKWFQIGIPSLAAITLLLIGILAFYCKHRIRRVSANFQI